VYPFDFEPEVNARNGVELARAARLLGRSSRPAVLHARGVYRSPPRGSGFWQ
jgi:hypothetical protein